MLIFESSDGCATAWTRQNAGKVLNAVKNSGEVRRTITGGTNLPESTSCAEVIVVFANRTPWRAAHDCARDGSGAEQLSAKANPEIVIEALAIPPMSELFKNLFRFLGIVADYRQLDQIVGDSGDVNRLEVHTSVAESVGDIGQHPSFVFEQYEMDLALREPNIRRLERAAGYSDIVRENARNRNSAADGYSRESLDVYPAAGERLRHSGEVSRVIGKLD
jgi:hypothetical protein